MSCVDYKKHVLFVCIDNIFCYINLLTKKKKVIATFIFSLCILK